MRVPFMESKLDIHYKTFVFTPSFDFFLFTHQILCLNVLCVIFSYFPCARVVCLPCICLVLYLLKKDN